MSLEALAHGLDLRDGKARVLAKAGSMTLPVPDEIYQPSEDSRLLLRVALQEAKAEDRAIEIGCGSGLICRELALKVRFIIATDISPHAARWVKSQGIEVVRADLFRGIRDRFDLVIFNPPYLPTREEERIPSWLNAALDGGETGKDVIFAFLEQLGSHLSPHGRALLIISSLNSRKEIMEKAMAEDLEVSLKATERCFFEQLHVLELTVAHERS
jgi:release factor glutamine methyltransferase